MSAGSLLSHQALASMAEDGVSTSMQWLDIDGHIEETEPQTSHPVQPRHLPLKVTEDPTNNFVRNTKSPLNVVTVMGPARSGKSTLLNLLAGCTDGSLFTTLPGSQPLTKGIVISNKLFTLHEFSSLDGNNVADHAAPEIRLLLVDTEGYGTRGPDYDRALFSPVVAASRVVVYNWAGELDVDQILDQLGNVARGALGMGGPGVTSTAAHDPEGSILGSTLFIVMNQYPLHEHLNLRALYDKLLSPEIETDPGSIRRNKIRKLVLSAFDGTEAFVLPINYSLQTDGDTSDNNAEPPAPSSNTTEETPSQFLENLRTLRAAISSALVHPTHITEGTHLTGRFLADIMTAFAKLSLRSGPLLLKDAVEEARHTAIECAKAQFSEALGKLARTYLDEPVKPTTRAENLLERSHSILLVQLESSISHLDKESVLATTKYCEELAARSKAFILETNTARLHASMSAKLLTTVKSLPAIISALFPDEEDALVPPMDEVADKCHALSATTAASFQATCESFEARSTPKRAVLAIQAAVEREHKQLRAKVASRWEAWSDDIVKTILGEVVESQEKTPGNVKGEKRNYEEDITSLLAKKRQDFRVKLAANYRGPDDAAQQLAKFDAAAAALIKKFQTNAGGGNLQSRNNLQDYLGTLKTQYTMRLNGSLVPFFEPKPYELITDEKDFQDNLAKYCQDNKIPQAETDTAKLEFTAYIASEKARFRPLYTEECSNYLTYLQGQLDSLLPILQTQYFANVNGIRLDLRLEATTQESIKTACDGFATSIRNTFELEQESYHVDAAGTVSRAPLRSATLQLEGFMAKTTADEMETFHTLVVQYNHALMAKYTTPVIDHAVGNLIPSVEALEAEVGQAREFFFREAKGDKASGGDAATQWGLFMDGEYMKLVEMVNRFNAFELHGRQQTQACSEEIQLAVLANIYRDCGSLANRLGMSWVSSQTFQFGEGGQPAVLSPRGCKENARIFKFENTYQPKKGDYDNGSHRTNLVFDKWSVELSAYQFGSQILTSMVPSTGDLITHEYPAQTTPYEVEVGNSYTESSSITNSVSLSTTASCEVSASEGVENVAKTEVKDAFSVTGDIGTSTTVDKTYTFDSRARLTLPPNRINQVNMVTFSTRTSLPYSARIRLVPSLTLADGYTIWGGGKSYRDNPGTSAIKEKFKKGGESRVYRDFEFGRCDQIRDQARHNEDPWEWTLAMERKPALVDILNRLAGTEDDTSTAAVTPYSMYIRGKWEGITGKRVVITTTSTASNAVLLPAGMGE